LWSEKKNDFFRPDVAQKIMLQKYIIQTLNYKQHFLLPLKKNSPEMQKLKLGHTGCHMKIMQIIKNTQKHT